jgi:hypothetical protein
MAEKEYLIAISSLQSLYSPCELSFLTRLMRSRTEPLREIPPMQIVVDSRALEG